MRFRIRESGSEGVLWEAEFAFGNRYLRKENNEACAI